MVRAAFWAVWEAMREVAAVCMAAAVVWAAMAFSEAPVAMAAQAAAVQAEQAAVKVGVARQPPHKRQCLGAEWPSRSVQSSSTRAGSCRVGVPSQGLHCPRNSSTHIGHEDYPDSC